ncbi:galactoside-binding lectin [Ancylostoma caninum]|uniref:Galectin n=1 Tax=Ancylostoma caninum TaxID=29170 RepID=A0A368FQI1_ANCCA|nr:galactoside-binding lectin [Ancylostoma caninum]
MLLFFKELPFVSAIVGGLFPGRAIVVSGMVLQSFASDTKRFYIDLCCGLLIQGDHMDNKALHFNPRFDTGGDWFSGQPDKQLVINSYISNRWGAEERFPNPFEIGKPFQIRILVLENYFKIAVNGKHICDYPHRVPVEEIKTIYVGGNIRVDFIEFQPPVSSTLPLWFR